VKPIEIVRAFVAAEQPLDAIPQFRVDHRWRFALEAGALTANSIIS
jgi:hypothetical protein